MKPAYATKKTALHSREYVKVIVLVASKSAPTNLTGLDKEMSNLQVSPPREGSLL